jgi:delta 1-pyrroline-5-carboxylate dehydrogenase
VLLVDTGVRRPTPGAGLVRFESTAQTHPYQREEIFGPEAALYPIDDLDEAIAAANDSDYGLAASVMTRSRAKYERCVGRIRTGVLNWNKGTVGASGGCRSAGSGKCGNDRPAGVTATLYCTAPQAISRSEAGFDANALRRDAEAVTQASRSEPQASEVHRGGPARPAAVGADGRPRRTSA